MAPGSIETYAQEGLENTLQDQLGEQINEARRALGKPEIELPSPKKGRKEPKFPPPHEDKRPKRGTGYHTS